MIYYNSLKYFNTFGINVYSNKIYIIYKYRELKKILLLNFKKKKITILLGEGSNILLMDDLYCDVIINRIRGIKVIQNIDFWFLKIYSGELWNDVVSYTINRNIFGLENLSFIPGTIGSAIVNNIGAYGLEIKDFIYCLEILDIFTGYVFLINNNDCLFSYRFSIFKFFLYNRFVILSVFLKIKKNWKPCLLYKDLRKYFNNLIFSNIKPIDIYERIFFLRSLRIPNPNFFGNAGSVFKNPIINLKHFLKIRKRYSEFFVDFKINYFLKYIKLPAAFLIDKCNLKGYTIGGAKIYEKQPLIIINIGNALPNDIYFLLKLIKKKVFKKFNILLELEIKIIKFLDYKYFFNKFNYNL